MQTNTRSVEAKLVKGPIFIGSWWRRGQIYWGKYAEHLLNAISSLNKMGRTKILRHYHQIELSQIDGWFINSWIDPSGTAQVPTQAAIKKRTCTAYLGKSKLWSTPVINQGRGHITKTASRAHPEITENTGTLLFYAKEINLTILVALGKNVAAQTSGTIKTWKAVHKSLD